jgi:beta-phosphoglucomutase family hydrolase
MRTSWPRRPPVDGLYAEHVDAVLFDLDGVVTDTASLHAAAWKETFDAVLRDRAAAEGGVFTPFDIDADYRALIDGRPRFDGTRAFLASRGLDLPDGVPQDPPGAGTVWAVANRKNELFGTLLAQQGVHTFPSTPELIRRLRQAGIRTGVVTASRNAARVLEAAKIADLFDVRVDGSDAAALGLPGKPDPATYLEAVRRLNVSPDRAVIFEDARAGVEAGRRGGFALVIGIDRTGDGTALATAGADIVVADLAELPLDLVRMHTLPGLPPGEDFCAGGQPRTGWILRYDGYDPAREGMREALCTVGNGYLGTRGAAPECHADGVHYPGTYLAGVYNRLVSTLDTRTLEHEHLVNAPNWLPLRFRVAGGDWFSPDTADLLTYQQELDLRSGVLTRLLRFRDGDGRLTRVEQRRFVHMGAPYLAALETRFVAENWSGRLEVLTGVDGNVFNGNLAEDAPLAKVHLAPEAAEVVDRNTVVLAVITTQSRIRIAMAARTRIHDAAGGEVHPASAAVTGDPGFAGQQFTVDIAAQRPLIVEKIVAVATSRDQAISEPTLAVRTQLARVAGFFDLLVTHERAWARLWERFDLAVDASDEVTLALRLHIFHLLQTLSPHTAQIDAGVPARGLHGEKYHGHVFWDEMFVFPVLNLRLPALSRALLLYRWRRLDEARHAAQQAGHRGAMYPWQSASGGGEETPTELYEQLLGRWIPNYSHLQRHIGIAIAYDVWQYYQVTGDVDFLAEYGAEMMMEIARFLASLATYDRADDRYGIAGIVGPDEYHDQYPGATEPGLRDNAYTNVMTAWVLRRALDMINLLTGHPCGQLWEQLGLSEAETQLWERISRRMRVPFHDGVISQFAGYEQLAEFDWASYRTRYGDLLNIDSILRSEGDTANRYRLSKQADVLMLLYLLSAEELRELFARLGYSLDRATIERTVSYYLARVAHGSSLSRIAHCWVQARADREGSWKLFTEALRGDLADTLGSSTRTGVHLGAMAGTVDLALRCYTGLETRDDTLYLHPQLPTELRALHAEVLYRGQWTVIDLDHQHLRVSLRTGRAAPIRINVDGAVHTLNAGQYRQFPLGG